VSRHINFLPLSKKRDNEVTLELPVQDLREEVQVGDKGSLQNDWNVAGVEKLYGVGLFIALHLAGSNRQFNTETLYRVRD